MTKAGDDHRLVVSLASGDGMTRLIRPIAVSWSRPVGRPCSSRSMTPPTGTSCPRSNAGAIQRRAVGRVDVPAGPRQHHRTRRRGAIESSRVGARRSGNAASLKPRPSSHAPVVSALSPRTAPTKRPLRRHADAPQVEHRRDRWPIFQICACASLNPAVRHRPARSIGASPGRRGGDTASSPSDAIRPSRTPTAVAVPASPA